MKHYHRVTDGSEKIPNNLVAGMLRFLHARNPDLEPLYAEVVFWHVEVDGDRIVREVGFTPDDEPILAAPVGRNPGTWTILAFNFDDRCGPVIDAESFHRGWHEAVGKMTPIIQNQTEPEPG